MQRNRRDPSPDRPGGRTRNYARFGRVNSDWGRDYGVPDNQNLRGRNEDDFRDMYGYMNQTFGRGGNTEGYADYETGHTHDGFRGSGYEVGGTEGSYHSGAREWQEETSISDFSTAGQDDFGRGEAYFHSRTIPSYAGRGPRGYRRSDERIHDEVCQLLTHDAHIDASEIEVEVDQGTVVLKGHLPSRTMKRRIELLLDEVTGIDDVRNEIRVGSSSATRDRPAPGIDSGGVEPAKIPESAGLRTTGKSGNSATTTPAGKSGEARS